MRNSKDANRSVDYRITTTNSFGKAKDRNNKTKKQKIYRSNIYVNIVN